MIFDAVSGNETIKNYLSRLIQTAQVPQSLLFAGPEGAGKSYFAETFAKKLLGTDKNQHSDIHHYRPEGKTGMHSIQSMRDFSEVVYMAPFEGKKKIFIIHEAHRMLTFSANALLKTFEEPAVDSVIILLTEAPERLLPTVLSRCQTIRFQLPVDKECLNTKMAHHPLAQKLLDVLAKGTIRSYPYIVELAKDFSSSIEDALKEQEEVLQKQFAATFSDTPTAYQKQMIEREVEGVIFMKKALDVKILFEAFLSWHRDLQLLHVSGNPMYLMHHNFKSELFQALERKEMLPIEKIEKAVSEAILSIERSTSLNIAIENFFLKFLVF